MGKSRLEKEYRMVLITGTVAATVSLVTFLVGGTGVWMYFHYSDSDDMPNIANSSFGSFDWHKTSKTDLIGVDFNLNSGGVIWEIGMIISFILITLFFCCCGIRHFPTPSCIKERRKKKKEARRERHRRKKEKLRREEEEERLRRIWKHDRRRKEHYRKLSEKIKKGHWSVRHLEEERKNEIHRIHRLASKVGMGQNSGEKDHSGEEKHRIVEIQQEKREEEGSRATTGMGETRSFSRVDSPSMYSETTNTSSDWYCGRDIYTEDSVYSGDTGEDEDQEDGGRSSGRSSRSSDTIIDIEQ